MTNASKKVDACPGGSLYSILPLNKKVGGTGVLVLTAIELIFFIVASMGLMFWICAENSVDNSGMFSLLLSSAYTESRPFLLLTLPCQRVGWGAQEVGRGHSWDS